MQLTIDSKFRPFSYDELVKPLLQYSDIYNKVEADYSTLAAQTEQWKDIVNQTKSPEAYAMYNKYASALNDVIEDFSKGMTLQNRRKLLDMKRKYASDIIPITKASEAMKEANDLRIKKGPDAIFEVGNYDSLDSFLHGKTANNEYQSRDAITKRTAAMTEATMASAMQDPEFKRVLGDQYWMLTQHTGGSYEDLKAAIANNPQAQNRFAEIKAQVMKDAGYDRYDARGKQAIENAINTGLYAGLDKPTRSFQANQNFQSDYQKAQLKLAQNADTRAEKQLELSAAGAGLRYNESTKQWERDPTLGIITSNGGTSLSSSDLENMGYTKEKDSKGNETGRYIGRGKKGVLKVYEMTPNGLIESSQKNPDKYMQAKNKATEVINNQVIKDNKENLTPYYFRAWSKGGSSNFEDYGNNDPNFSTSDAETTFEDNGEDKTLSISPGGGIHGKARTEIKNYILRFAGLQDSSIPISDGVINQVADEYFKIYRDQDWVSNNHFKVEFLNGNGIEFPHSKDSKTGELSPQYNQSKEFKDRYKNLRKDLLGNSSY